MTNIVAAVVVSVVTNVTEDFPKHLVAEPCPQGLQGCAVFHGKWVNDENAKEKTLITTCKELTVLKFDWNGPREIVTEKVLWQSNVVQKLEWK